MAWPQDSLVPAGRRQAISTIFQLEKLAGELFRLCTDGSQVSSSAPLTLIMTCLHPSEVRSVQSAAASSVSYFAPESTETELR